MRKKRFLLLLLLTVALFLSSCENQKTEAFNKIRGRLALTGEKAAEVEPIFDEEADDIAEILETKNDNPRKFEIKYRLDQQDPAAIPENFVAMEINPIKKIADVKLATILTKEQLADYDSIIDEYVHKLAKDDLPRQTADKPVEQTVTKNLAPSLVQVVPALPATAKQPTVDPNVEYDEYGFVIHKKKAEKAPQYDPSKITGRDII